MAAVRRKVFCFRGVDVMKECGRNLPLVVIASALMLSGCATHLEVSPAGTSVASRQGIAYYLPFTQFETAVTWTIVDCDASTLKPEIVIKTEAKPTTSPDPDALFVIDYQSLDAWTKTSSINVAFYDSGAIKSINASADDKTSEIATSIVSSIGKIVKFAATGGAASHPICNESVMEALNKIKQSKLDIEKTTRELELKLALLAEATARMVRAGDAASSATLELVDNRVGEVTAAQIELEIAKKKLAGLVKSLSHTSGPILFPGSSDVTVTSKAIAIPDSKFSVWFSNGGEMGPGAITSYFACHGVWLELTSAAPNLAATKENGKAQSGNGNKLSGVRYRIGAPGQLRAFRKPNCPADDQPETDEDLLVGLHKVTLLQRGQTFFLPFASEPFTNASLSATFSEAGVMTSAGYEQKKAAGEDAVKVLATMTDKAMDIGTALRAERKTDLAKLKEQTELAKAKADLAAAERALLVSPNTAAQTQTGAFDADTALKKAEVANIEAEIALRKAKAARDGAL